MTSLLGYLWVGIGVLGGIDGIRHHAADWHHAKRQKPFWVVFMFFFGPLFVLPYLAFVRPRFPAKGSDDSDRFTKD